MKNGTSTASIGGQLADLFVLPVRVDDSLAWVVLERSGVEVVAGHWRALAPLNRWLARAVIAPAAIDRARFPPISGSGSRR